jgi:hypothetical protein
LGSIGKVGEKEIKYFLCTYYGNAERRIPELANVVLPKGVLEYFTLLDIVRSEETLSFYLSEQNIVPEEYVNDKL